MRASWKAGVGLGLSLLFLGLALRNVEWPDVWASWRAARVDLLALGLGLLVASWMIGAFRWRVLLSAVPGLRIRDTFAYITIGYLANAVLPLRLGDVARASLMGRRRHAGITRALGSITSERLMDVLMLVGLTLALTLVLEIPAPIRAGLASLTVVAVAGLAGLIAISLNRQRLPRLTQWVARIMPHRLADRGVKLLGNFSSGADAFHGPAGGLAVLCSSALLWLVTGGATLAWVRAFHLDVPWYAGFFVLVMVNLGSAIPSSPGYVGVYHYLAVLALSLWTSDRSAALAYAIGTHALNMLANVGLGTYFLAREGMTWHSLKEEIGSQNPGAEVRDDS